MNTNIEIDVYEGPYKIFIPYRNIKKILLEDENICEELFYYLGQYNKYNKSDIMDYYAINKLIYIYLIETLKKFYWKMKIFAKNYFIIWDNIINITNQTKWIIMLLIN
jgi:hypothetical protein